MKNRNAAPRSLRDAAINAQHERRPMKPLHNTARDDAHDAAMPTLTSEHQYSVRIGHRLLNALFKYGARNFGFRLLAVLIQFMQSLRQLTGASWIFGQKHFDHF